VIYKVKLKLRIDSESGYTYYALPGRFLNVVMQGKVKTKNGLPKDLLSTYESWLLGSWKA